MKKTKFLLLAVMMLLSVVLTACQDNAPEKRTAVLDYEIGDTGGLTLPFTQNNENIRILTQTDVSDINNKYIIEKFREITGLNIQIDAFPTGSAQNKLATMVAAKNIPDIVGTAITDSMAMDLAMQGALAPVDDYIDEMPNFKSVFVDNEENSWIFKSRAAPDGKLYGVAHYDQSRDVNHGMLYRKDIFDKNNIKMWKSPDEFYNVLKKLKSIYPDSAPFASKMQKDIFSRWAISWGMVASMPYYDENEKIWKYTNTDPKFKEMLDYMKKLYDEQLLDPEFLTMTEGAWTSKMTKEALAFTTFDWIGRLDQFSQIASETVPGYDLRYGNPVGPKQTIQTLPKVAGSSFVAQSENSVYAFKLLDLLLSPAGAELMTMGIKGETYELDENNFARYTEFPEGTKVEIKDLENKYGMFLLGMYMRFDRRSNYYLFTEREQEAQAYAKNPAGMEPIDPALVFDGDEKAEITQINTTLVKACEEFASKYVISSESGDAAWNTWLTQASGMGSERLVEIYNAAQKRYDSL